MSNPTPHPEASAGEPMRCPLCGIPAKGHDAEYLRLRASTNVMCALTEAEIPEWVAAEIESANTPDEHALEAAHARCKELCGCPDIIGYGGASIVDEIVTAYLVALHTPTEAE